MKFYLNVLTLLKLEAPVVSVLPFMYLQVINVVSALSILISVKLSCTPYS